MQFGLIILVVYLFFPYHLRRFVEIHTKDVIIKTDKSVGLFAIGGCVLAEKSRVGNRLKREATRRSKKMELSGKKKLKVGEIRKKEILEAAKKVFLRKGFTATVMEDIISATSLSRGGVYYHYQNKLEILHDLMREGIAYRLTKINEFLTSNDGELSNKAIAHMIVDKILDTSDLMSVYAIYLQAQKTNRELSDLLPMLVMESLSAVKSGAIVAKDAKREGYDYLSNDFLIFFMNTVILGCEILPGARDNFCKNREYFIKAINLFLELYADGRIK